MEAVSIIVLIVMIILNAFAASRMQEIAEQKGSRERFWAWCFWLPLAGYAMVIALPDRGNQINNYENSREYTKYRGDMHYRNNQNGGRKELLDDEDDYEFVDI